jgi:hypothetical protein
MAAYDYVRTRRKFFLGLADHCHDKAIEQDSARDAAEWIELMDTLLWCALPEGDTESIGSIAHPRAKGPTE